MAEITELKPSTKERPESEEPTDVTTSEEFQRRSAEREAERRSKNPLNISEIFELIRDGKLAREKLDGFDLGQELTAALKWVIDLNEKLKKSETTLGDQKSAIEQMEMTLREREATIEQLKKLIADMEDKFPPLGEA